MAFGSFVGTQKAAGSGAFNTNTPTNTTKAVAYPGAVTSGSFLVACLFWNSATATCTVSDSVNGAWTAIGSPTAGANSLSGYRIQMFYKGTTGAGTPTVTATLNTAGLSGGLAIMEYASGPAILDGTQFGYVTDIGGHTATVPLQTASVTPSAASALLVACCIVGDVCVSTGAVEGFTFRFSNDTTSTWGGNGISDYLPGNTTTRNGDFGDTNAGDDDGLLGIATFVPSGPATVTGQLVTPFTFGVVTDGTIVTAGPVNTVAPEVTGTPTQGQTLTCSPGTWTT